MEEKKTKWWKVLLIILAVLVCIYVIMIVTKQGLINKVRNLEQNFSEQSNYHVLVNLYKISDNDYTIYETCEYWAKDGIYKSKNTTNMGTYFTWNDENTGKKYSYAESDNGISSIQDVTNEYGNYSAKLDSIYNLNFLTNDNFSNERLKYLLNPFSNTIKTVNFAGENWYMVKRGTTETSIKKDNGLLVIANGDITEISDAKDGTLTSDNTKACTIKYCSLNTVTDEDVALPDISNIDTTIEN